MQGRLLLAYRLVNEENAIINPSEKSAKKWSWEDIGLIESLNLGENQVERIHFLI